MNASFIIPAHNEVSWIGDCLRSIDRAMSGAQVPHEVIVVDDSSSDATAAVAREAGAKVVSIRSRHISAARNAGARAARGDVFVFVDADTLLHQDAAREAWECLRAGAVGGGAIPRYDAPLPFWARVGYPLFVLVTRVFQQPGGSCLFCTREAFAAVGGFSERHFAAEDAQFTSKLKTQGAFVVLRSRVLTSGRNLRAHSAWHFARLIVRLARRGPDGFQSRKGLDVWYRPSRGERS